MKNFKKVYLSTRQGFTMIEILVVVAIVGILSTVVFASLSMTRIKSQKAAFKSEVASYQKKAILNCTSATSALALPVDTSTTDWASSFTVNNCTNGNGVFSIAATSFNVSTCTATVNETNATFTGCN